MLEQRPPSRGRRRSRRRRPSRPPRRPGRSPREARALVRAPGLVVRRLLAEPLAVPLHSGSLAPRRCAGGQPPPWLAARRSRRGSCGASSHSTAGGHLLAAPQGADPGVDQLAALRHPVAQRAVEGEAQPPCQPARRPVAAAGQPEHASSGRARRSPSPAAAAAPAPSRRDHGPRGASRRRSRRGPRPVAQRDRAGEARRAGVVRASTTKPHSRSVSQPPGMMWRR